MLFIYCLCYIECSLVSPWSIQTQARCGKPCQSILVQHSVQIKWRMLNCMIKIWPNCICAPKRFQQSWTHYKGVSRRCWWERSRSRNGSETALSGPLWWTNGFWRRWTSMKMNTVYFKQTVPSSTCSAKMVSTK